MLKEQWNGMNILLRTIEIVRITPGWVDLVYSDKKKCVYCKITNA